LTSDENFFIISFLCCNDSDGAKAKLAEVESGNQWYRVMQYRI